MSDIISPYINTEYHTRVLLLPNQIGKDLYLELKNNLRKQMERRCNKYGYISKVYEITDYSEGIIENENLLAAIVFNVKFTCRICIPYKNTKILVAIQKITKALISATNGPMMILIPSSNINTNNFIFDLNTSMLKSKIDDQIEKLEPSMIVVINTIAVKFHVNDDQILIIGSLERLATKEEQKNYFEDTKILNDNTIDEDEKIISKNNLTTEDFITEDDMNVKEEENQEDEGEIEKTKETTNLEFA